MQTEPTPGRYRHYKGGEYEVIGTARHSETDELLVVYRCLYDNGSLWVRPLAMFMESVVDGGQKVPRFAYCGVADGLMPGGKECAEILCSSPDTEAVDKKSAAVPYSGQ